MSVEVAIENVELLLFILPIVESASHVYSCSKHAIIFSILSYFSLLSTLGSRFFSSARSCWTTDLNEGSAWRCVSTLHLCLDRSDKVFILVWSTLVNEDRAVPQWGLVVLLQERPKARGAVDEVTDGIDRITFCLCSGSHGDNYMLLEACGWFVSLSRCGWFWFSLSFFPFFQDCPTIALGLPYHCPTILQFRVEGCFTFQDSSVPLRVSSVDVA